MSSAQPEAVVIVLRRGDRLLAIRRAAGITRGGWWTAPTGRIEPGEAAADTVVRETREELGIDVRAIRELWQCSTDDGRYRLRWWLAEAADDAVLTPDPAEIAELRWVRADQYLRLEPGFPGHAPFFADIWPLL